MQWYETLTPQQAHILLEKTIPAYIAEQDGPSHTATSAQRLIDADCAGYSDEQKFYTVSTTRVLEIALSSGAIGGWFYIEEQTILDKLSVDFVACISPHEAICIQTVSTREQARIHRNTLRKLFHPYDPNHPIIYILQHRDIQDVLIPEHTLCTNLIQALPKIQRFLLD